MRQCPKCGLTNPDTAVQCDCGHPFEASPMQPSGLSQRTVSIAAIIVGIVALLGFSVCRLSICVTKKTIRDTSMYSGGLLGEYNQVMQTASKRVNIFSFAWVLTMGGLAGFLQYQRKRKLKGVRTLPMTAAASGGAALFVILVYIALMVAIR